MKRTTWVELLSGPDERGNYGYSLYWPDPNPASCLTCGSNPGSCDCYGNNKTRGQIFWGRPPEGIPQVDRRSERLL